MKSPKIKTLKELSKTIKKLKMGGKKIALITGCFDVLHIGHIKLFRFAKKNSDIVIVGLDSDMTIQASKGKNRPVNKVFVRSDQLSELESIDFIFHFKTILGYGERELDAYHEEIYRILKPNYLITNPKADSFWKKKEKRVKKFGIRLLKDSRPRSNTSSHIITRILERDL